MSLEKKEHGLSPKLNLKVGPVSQGVAQGVRLVMLFLNLAK